MRLFLYSTPASHDEPQRFVQLVLQADLFGGWELVRESGQTGGRSSLRRNYYPDRPSALAAIEKICTSQIKKGFQLTSSAAP